MEGDVLESILATTEHGVNRGAVYFHSPLGNQRAHCVPPHHLSGMWREGDDGQLALLWAIAPEKSVRGRRMLLHVSLEDLSIRIIGMLEGVKDMRVQGWMPGISLEEAERLFDLLHQACVAG